jgi:hypothetical protein
MRRHFADLGDPIGQLTHDGMIFWRQRLESEIAARGDWCRSETVRTRARLRPHRRGKPSNVGLTAE